MKPIRAAAAAAVLLQLASIAGCYTQSPKLSARELAAADCAQLEESFRDHAGYYGRPKPDSYAASVRERAMRTCHADWEPRIKREVLAGEVHEGMTQDQVFWSWGPPSRTAREDSPWGQVTRWEWGDSTDRADVTFRDGQVFWWSTGR